MPSTVPWTRLLAGCLGLSLLASCGAGSATSLSRLDGAPPGLQAPTGAAIPAAPGTPAAASPGVPAAPASPTNFVSRNGAQLLLGGKAFRFVGINRYDLAGGPQAKKCPYAGTVAEMQAYRETVLTDAEAMGVSVVRLWAYQNFAGPTGTDFTAFDDVVARAKAHHIRLILTLEDQWDYCSLPAGASNFSKTPAWYAGGYKTPYGYPLAYDAYVTALVQHFSKEPTVAAWQLMNEAESADPASLQQFAATMATLIKKLDPNHLVSVGTLACGQKGTDPANYKILHAEPHIDLLEAHDYGSPQVALPACVAADMQVAKLLNKPFFVGEAGISTSVGPAALRGSLLAAKLSAGATAGMAGYAVWQFAPSRPDGDGYSFGAGEPMGAALLSASQGGFVSQAAP
jgi:mannan endo-1,4-beta-mannosidase